MCKESEEFPSDMDEMPQETSETSPLPSFDSSIIYSYLTF